MAEEPNELTRRLTIAIESFAAVIWFGWGQSEPPDWLSIALIAGTVLGILTGLSGVRIAVLARRRGEQSALQDDAARQRYLIVVRLEFGLLIIIAIVLRVTGAADWIPVLVAAGVGIHFVPLAGVFHDPRMTVLGIAIVAVAVVAAIAGLATDVPMVTITGAGTGACLLIGAAAALVLRSAGRSAGTVGRRR